MNIAFTYNVRHLRPSLKNKQAMKEAEFDELPAIKGITQALKKLGHKVFLIEANEDAYLKLKRLKSKIDLVFNIAEGIYGEDREAQIPAMLEMLRIPYVGSKPLTQAICLNKAVTKKFLNYYGIPTPNFQLFETADETLKQGLRFPLIVKPNSEGSSKGILQSAVVRNKKDLKKQIRKLMKDFNRAVIAEEFLEGREFTIGLIGNNDSVEILPPVEIDFSVLPKGFLPFDSYEAKWLFDGPKSNIKTLVCPAKINKILWNKIKKICLKAKEVLGVLDWCRIDIRLNSNNEPYILEINQIPGIHPDPTENSRFPLAAKTAGYTYEEMLNKIIKSACQRYKISS